MAPPRSAEERHVSQREAMVELTSPEVERLGVPETLRRITEVAAWAMQVARVSVWRLEGDAIVAGDLYDARTGQHSSGMRLVERTHPEYFRALRTLRVIAADDARADPRTREFRDDYLVPLGIRSMLDAPVPAGAGLGGVLCHEHVGSQRRWTTDEQTFALALAHLVELAFARDGRGG